MVIKLSWQFLTGLTSLCNNKYISVGMFVCNFKSCFPITLSILCALFKGTYLKQEVTRVTINNILLNLDTHYNMLLKFVSFIFIISHIFFFNLTFSTPLWVMGFIAGSPEPEFPEIPQKAENRISTSFVTKKQSCIYSYSSHLTPYALDL